MLISEIETYTGNMRCHFDNRLGNQGDDGSSGLFSRVAQGELVLGVIKALHVKPARCVEESKNGNTIG